MNVKGVIVEQIDWDGTSKSLTMQHDFKRGDMWVAFPSDYDEPRTGPFYFQNPQYEQEFNSNVAECRARKITRENFYEVNGVYTYKTLWHNLPTDNEGLTYYALYLPEYAVLTKLNLYDPRNPQKQFKRTVFRDEQKPRYIIYLQCASKYGIFNFNLECEFNKDKAGFASSNYSDEYHSDFYSSPDAWKYHTNLKKTDATNIQNFFSDQVVINHGKLNQTFKTNRMNKNTERLIVFIFGVVFLITMLVIAIFIPEPKPFQWNIFKTVLALAGAGVAAFIPGFIDVEINKFVRAGGALAVFVLLYFYNPANLVINYKQVTKKYDLLSFKLGEDITTTDVVINQVTNGDSADIAEIKNTAKRRLDIIQNNVDQLGLKINLNNLFETTNSKHNIFPQSKYDYVIDGLNELYSRNTVSYFRVGWYLTWIYVEGSIVTDSTTQKEHPEFLREFVQLYPKISSDLNADLKNLGYDERVPEKYSDINEIKDKTGKAKEVVLKQLEN